jgi:hypothetical protein
MLHEWRRREFLIGFDEETKRKDCIEHPGID